MTDNQPPAADRVAFVAGWLALVLGEADKLRAKGVLSIGAEGCTVTLAPLPPVAVPSAAAPTDEATRYEEPVIDPLYDPHTYPGGVVPGFVTGPRPFEDDR